MGPVVTINSATLVNKGLEVIEAHLLFGIPYDRIEVVVHPTSVVHSMVEFVDGSTLVAGQPADHADPDRARAGLARPGARRRAAGRLDPGQHLGVLPARRRGVPGGPPGPPARGARVPPRPRSTTPPTRWRRGVPAGRLRFVDIIDTVAHVLGVHDVPSEETLTVDDVLAADAWARDEATPRDREAPMTPLLYLLGVLLFVFAILASIGLHELGHMIPAKAFGGKVTQYFIGFGPTVWSRTARRDGVRRQGDPARRLRQDRRHAPARRGARRQGRVRRRGQPRRDRAQVQHRPVRPARLRRPRRRVGDHHRRRRGPAVLPDGLVEEGRRDGRRPDGEPRSSPSSSSRPCSPRTATPRTSTSTARSTWSRPASCPPPRRAAPAPPADPVSPAAQAGLKPGDRFVSFNGTPVHSWDADAGR